MLPRAEQSCDPVFRFADGTGRKSGPGGTKKPKSVLSGQPPLIAAVIDLKVQCTEPAKRLERPWAAVDLALPIETEILGNNPEPSGEGSGSGRFEAKQAAKSVFGEFLTDEYEAVGSFVFVTRGDSSDLIQRVAKLKEEIPAMLPVHAWNADRSGGQ